MSELSDLRPPGGWSQPRAAPAPTPTPAPTGRGLGHARHGDMRLTLDITCIRCGSDDLHQTHGLTPDREDNRERRIRLECAACRHTVIVTTFLHDLSLWTRQQ